MQKNLILEHPTSKRFNKGLAANLAAFVLCWIGLISPWYGPVLLTMGLFALSGGITNAVAVYMLFERVPGLVGSGVIPNRFEEFKASIRRLMMEQFFSAEHLQNFIIQEEQNISAWFRPQRLIDLLDYDLLYQRLTETFLQSSFGGLIKTLGGQHLFEQTKEPLVRKIRESLIELTQRDDFKNAVAQCIDSETLTADIHERIEKIIDQRLAELTAQRVKIIMQKLIHEHLGWLVVWGVVLGGLIGLLAGFLQYVWPAFG